MTAAVTDRADELIGRAPQTEGGSSRRRPGRAGNPSWRAFGPFRSLGRHPHTVASIGDTLGPRVSSNCSLSPEGYRPSIRLDLMGHNGARSAPVQRGSEPMRRPKACAREGRGDAQTDMNRPLTGRSHWHKRGHPASQRRAAVFVAAPATRRAAHSEEREFQQRQLPTVFQQALSR